MNENKLKEFKVMGYERIDRMAKSGSGCYCRVNLPKRFLNKNIAVIVIE